MTRRWRGGSACPHIRPQRLHAENDVDALRIGCPILSHLAQPCRPLVWLAALRRNRRAHDPNELLASSRPTRACAV